MSEADYVASVFFESECVTNSKVFYEPFRRLGKGQLGEANIGVIGSCGDGNKFGVEAFNGSIAMVSVF